MLSLFGIVFSAVAENYFREGTTWVMNGVAQDGYGGTVDFTERVALEGSYTIDEKKCSLVHAELYRGIVWDGVYIHADGEKVYFKLKDMPESDWLLAYDFGLQVGEGCYVNSIPTSNNDSPVRTFVKCVGVESLDGWEIMNMEEYSSDDSSKPVHVFYPIKWIRGLGSYYDWFVPNMSDWVGRAPSILVSVSYDGEVIYSNTARVKESQIDDTEVRINGNALHISGALPGSRTIVTDISGRLVYDFINRVSNCTLPLPSNGLYIVRVGNRSYRLLAL